MQEILGGRSGDGGGSRYRLPDLWELARRFSGLAAIAVLGVAMLGLALRSDVQPSSLVQPATDVASSQPIANSDTTVRDLRDGAPSVYVPPEPELVFYLYDTTAQLRLLQAAESVAGQEAANETVMPLYRQFVALQASTPELELAARDAVFQAMLENEGRTRVIVHDLRDR